MNIWFLLSVLLSYRCTHACKISAGLFAAAHTQTLKSKCYGSKHRSLFGFQMDTYERMFITHTGHFLYVIKMLTIISFRFSLSFLFLQSLSLYLQHTYLPMFGMSKDVLLWKQVSIRYLCHLFPSVSIALSSFCVCL